MPLSLLQQIKLLILESRCILWLDASTSWSSYGGAKRRRILACFILLHKSIDVRVSVVAAANNLTPRKVQFKQALFQLCYVPSQKNASFKKCVLLFYLWGVSCLPVYLCAPYLSDGLTGQKRASDPLKLESQIIVNHRVVVGYHTQVLWTNSQCS